MFMLTLCSQVCRRWQKVMLKRSKNKMAKKKSKKNQLLLSPESVIGLKTSIEVLSTGAIDLIHVTLNLLSLTYIGASY